MKRSIGTTLLLTLAACAPVRAADDATGAAPALAIVGVAVADGTTPALRRDWTVVVRDGRIAAAGPASSVRAPRGATVVDGRGRYLVPGLWDMHVHLDGKDADWLPLLVAHGVTAVRDVGTLRAADADSVRRVAAARGWPVPRVLVAGFVVETPGSLAFMERLATLAASTPHPTPRWHRGHVAVTTPEAALAVCDSVARSGGRMLKFIDPGTPAVHDALARAARTHGLALVGHAPQALRTVGPWRAVDAGQRSFEHLFGWANAIDSMPDASRAALAARIRERDAALVPTLLVSGQDRIPTERFWDLVTDSLGRLDPRNRWISPHERSQWAVRLGMLRDPLRPAPSLEALNRAYDRETAALRVLHRLGAPVLPGTDLGMYLVYPGSSLHEELALLAREVGMTPFDALRSATLASARWAGVADSVGSVRAGQVADLVLLDADPLADVAHLARIRAVVVGGRLHDRTALDAITARAPRPAR
ncbi:amidohydrolase family protein [Roseisolibacter agri]|uniref:Amidohydrolase n=1 Tax=Roseisolibacter agri TaxID=2014610 RepID=A0AA37Q5U3_9BACT|nr:amidohydrolase family protein [Roseisolibacter agri]GLC26874.1 amidohydrolase [Roseisolibacter agri]